LSGSAKPPRVRGKRQGERGVDHASYPPSHGTGRDHAEKEEFFIYYFFFIYSLDVFSYKGNDLQRAARNSGSVVRVLPRSGGPGGPWPDSSSFITPS
jgi:hypothetical protein